MPGAFIIAARTVAIACASVSRSVRVIQLGPDLFVEPENLFERTFSEVGIEDEDAIRNFRSVLVHLVPGPAALSLERISLSPAHKIGAVVELLESAIEAGESG